MKKVKSVKDIIREIEEERIDKEIKTIEDIREKFKNGGYDFNESRPKTKKLKPEHIFDEDLSVKKNREMVIEHNNKVDEEIKAYNNRYNLKISEFNNDLIKVIKEETGLNDKKANVLFNYIYRESHSGGYNDMIIMSDELIEVVNEIIK